jgi:hypothetical protein
MDCLIQVFVLVGICHQQPKELTKLVLCTLALSYWYRNSIGNTMGSSGRGS